MKISRITVKGPLSATLPPYGMGDHEGPIEPLLIGVAEAATLLGLSPQSLRNRLSRGEIPPTLHVRLGGRRLFVLARLKAWVDELTAASETPSQPPGRRSAKSADPISGRA